MMIEEIRKEGIFNYLNENKGRPVYVVRNNEFLISVLMTGEGKYNITSYLHQDQQGEPFTKEVTFDKLENINKFKDTDRFLTALGAVKLLDLLEKR